VLAGRFETTRRMRLEVRALRGDTELCHSLALNDAVIARSDLSRMIDLETWTDGVAVTTYHGDGLIVATPTGSTAYTLSAGGPILMPNARVFVLTPICPHALTQRPLVLPETAELEVAVHTRDGAGRLTVDGQVGVALQEGDHVRVRACATPAEFVVSPFRSRFDVLRTKLGWGAA
jgi:NAD+ kinase